MKTSNLFRPSMSPWTREQPKLDEAKGMEYTLEDAAANNLEKVLMETIAATLTFHYPRPKGLPFWWGIEINGSVTWIFNLALSGREGYVLHTKNLTTEKVVRAGGEILERYGVPRDPRKYSAEMIIAKHESNPRRFLKFDA